VPSAVILHSIQPPVNPDYFFPGLTLLLLLLSTNHGQV
jgi:hypothetical protein